MANEKRLIGANDVYSLIDKSGFAGLHVADIDTIPRVDAVEVVRCRDCIMKDPPEAYGDLQCHILGIPMKDDDFCSYGERKDGDGNG